MSGIFKSAEELKEAFKLADCTEYEKFTPFNKDLGFSVQRAYPEQSRFKPPTKKDGTPDSYALIGILYEPGRASPDKPKIVPISGNVSVFSRYISKNWDYDFTDSGCPTEESVTASKKTPRPVDLSAFDEFAYDHERDVFLNASGEVIDGMDIINGLYDDHLATIDKFKGIVFRWKLDSQNKAVALCGVFREALKWLLRKICGRSLEPDEAMRGIWDNYRPEDMKLLKTESINVFGYKASKNVIITFCILIIAGYTVVKFAKFLSAWLAGIGNNSLLGFCFSILIISFLDHILPTFFLWSINSLTKLRLKLISKKVKFK